MKAIVCLACMVLQVFQCLSNLTLATSIKSFNSSLAKYDYGINWTLSAAYQSVTLYTNYLIPTASYSTTKFILNNGTALQNYNSTGGEMLKMVVQNNSFSPNMNIIVINGTVNCLNSVQIYQLNQSSFTSKFNSSSVEGNDIGWGVSNCAFFISSASSKLYKISMATYAVVGSIVYSGEKPILFTSNGGTVVVYTQNNTNGSNGNIKVYNENLVLRKSFTTPYYYSVLLVGSYNCISIFYDPVFDLLVKVFPNAVQVWQLSNSTLLNSVQIQWSLLFQPFYKSGIICKQFLVTIANNQIQWIELASWSVVQTYNIPIPLITFTYTIEQLRCYAEQNITSVYANIGGSSFIYQFSMSYIGSYNINTNSSNISNTNNTNLNNSNLNNPDTNTTNNITNNINTTNTTTNTTINTTINSAINTTINTTINSNSSFNSNNSNYENYTYNETINSTINDTYGTSNSTFLNLTNQTTATPLNTTNNTITINIVTNHTNNDTNININNTNTNTNTNINNINNNTNNDTTNTTNTTNNINNISDASANSNNTNYHNYPNENTQKQQNAFNTFQFINNTNNNIIAVLKSEELLGAGQLISSISGVSSANSITRAFVRPIINLLDDFWFYKFHSITYPQFVQYFTADVDLFSQLRIKPAFIKFDINFRNFYQLNQLYASQSMLQQSAPTTPFALQSLKDIYTINISIVVLQFILLLGVRLFVSMIKHRHVVLKRLYSYLVVNTLWWSVLLAFIECNISPIVFYASIQLNIFVHFATSTKLYLVVVVLFLFIIFTYSYLFYALLYKYEKSEYSKQVLDYGTYNHHGFWLQCCFKCQRSLCQAFIHGIFINHQHIQIIGLILFNLAQIYALCKLHKYFMSVLSFFLIFLYTLVFLLFNIVLIVYTIDSQNGTYTQHKSQIYNFILVIIVLLLFGLVALRIISAILTQIVRKINQVRKTNQTINIQEDDKILKSAKSISLLNQKVRKIQYLLNNLKVNNQHQQEQSMPEEYLQVHNTNTYPLQSSKVCINFHNAEGNLKKKSLKFNYNPSFTNKSIASISRAKQLLDKDQQYLQKMKNKLNKETNKKTKINYEQTKNLNKTQKRIKLKIKFRENSIKKNLEQEEQEQTSQKQTNIIKDENQKQKAIFDDKNQMKQKVPKQNKQKFQTKLRQKKMKSNKIKQKSMIQIKNNTAQRNDEMAMKGNLQLSIRQMGNKSVGNSEIKVDKESEQSQFRYI